MHESISRDVRALARSISQETNQDIILYNGPINEEGFGELVEVISKLSRPNPLLVLVTNGGQARSAYRIARFLQTVNGGFTLFPPSFCKSAGTLLALGAQKLVLGLFSELGPLDVQIYKRDELFERKSGLLTQTTLKALGEQAFDAFEHILLQIKNRSGGLVTFETSSRIAAEMAAGVFSGLYTKVNPNILGEEYRDMAVGEEYGRRLVTIGGNADYETVHILVNSYPSHDFIIDSSEADGLFFDVEKPSQALYKLVGALGPLAAQELDDVVVGWLSEPDVEAAYDEGDHVHDAVTPDAHQRADEPRPDGVEGGGGVDRGSDQEPNGPRSEDDAGGQEAGHA